MKFGIVGLDKGLLFGCSKIQAMFLDGLFEQQLFQSQQMS